MGYCGCESEIIEWIIAMSLAINIYMIMFWIYDKWFALHAEEEK